MSPPLVTRRDHEQLPTVGISVLDIVRHSSFADGYIGAAKGDALDTFYNCRDAWFYERGRLVAIAARHRLGRAPKLWCDTDLGSVINPQVISLAGEMMMKREMT